MTTSPGRTDRGSSATSPRAAAPAAARPPSQVGARQRVRRLLREHRAVAAGLVYAGAHACALLGIWWMAARAHQHLSDRLWRYDGRWYVDIVTHGYDRTVAPYGDGLGHTNLAFFPLYPWLMHALSWLSGMSPQVAGLWITTVAGVAAGVLVAAVARQIGVPERGALAAVVLWACAPHAVVLSMVYSEALFTACAAGSLLLLLRRRWYAAGLVGAAACLTRPSGAALLAAMLVVFVTETVTTRRMAWRPFAAGAIATAGFVVHPLFCWWVLGRPDAWFYVQSAAWHSALDGGRYEVHTLGELLTGTHPAVLVEVAVTLVLATALVVAMVTERFPASLIVYTAVLVLVAWGTGGYHQSKARFLLPAFPIAILLGRALGAVRPAVMAAVLVAVVLVSSWYGGYLLTVWDMSP